MCLIWARHISFYFLCTIISSWKYTFVAPELCHVRILKIAPSRRRPFTTRPPLSCPKAFICMQTARCSSTIIWVGGVSSVENPVRLFMADHCWGHRNFCNRIRSLSAGAAVNELAGVIAHAIPAISGRHTSTSQDLSPCRITFMGWW